MVPGCRLTLLQPTLPSLPDAAHTGTADPCSPFPGAPSPTHDPYHIPCTPLLHGRSAAALPALPLPLPLPQESVRSPLYARLELCIRPSFITAPWVPCPCPCPTPESVHISIVRRPPYASRKPCSVLALTTAPLAQSCRIALPQLHPETCTEHNGTAPTTCAPESPIHHVPCSLLHRRRAAALPTLPLPALPLPLLLLPLLLLLPRHQVLDGGQEVGHGEALQEHGGKRRSVC